MGVAGIQRNWTTIAAAFSPAAGGPLGAWRAMRQWARYRSLTVTTRADPFPAPVLLTRIRMDGDVSTAIDRAWLRTADPAQADPLVAQHFRSVRAALTGWPAVLASARLTTWGAGIGGSAVLLRDALADGPRGLLDVVTAWQFWLPLLPFAAGLCLRPALRFWLRRRFRHPLGG